MIFNANRHGHTYAQRIRRGDIVTLDVLGIGVRFVVTMDQSGLDYDTWVKPIGGTDDAVRWIGYDQEVGLAYARACNASLETVAVEEGGSEFARMVPTWTKVGTNMDRHYGIAPSPVAPVFFGVSDSTAYLALLG